MNRSWLLTMLGMVCLLLIPRCARAALVLEGYWPLNGDLLDASSNTNHGAYEAGSAAASPVPYVSGFDGTSGGALDLDGSHYVRIGNHSSLNLGEDSFSATAWINLDAVQTTPDYGMRIFDARGRGGGGVNPGFQFKVSVQSGGTVWKFHDASLDDGAGNVRSMLETDPQTGWSTGAWHHVAMVYAADDELRFYVDGNSVATVDVGNGSAGEFGSLSNAMPRGIGAAMGLNSTPYTAPNPSPGNLDQHLLGLVDDVAIFRGVLDDTQVLALYNQSATPLSLVPEPATWLLLLLGSLCLPRFVRRR